MSLLTQTLSHFEVVVLIGAADTNGKLVTRQKTYELSAHGADDAAAMANALTDTAAFLTDLAAMLEADIISHRLNAVWITADAVAATNVNPYKEAVLTLKSGVSASKYLSHSVPAPADGILTGGEIVDPTDTAVLNYLANFISTAYFRISDGEFIADTAALVRSRVRSVSSGKTYG